jgi:hypothetical protein
MEHERSPPKTPDQPPSSDDDRREFLKKCGKFAAITPPAVTLLLSTSLTSKAIAKSGGRPGNGYGDTNHEHYGPPGQIKKAESGGAPPGQIKKAESGGGPSGQIKKNK